MSQELIVDLKKGTRSFRFLLDYRPLDLGGAGTIRYYWMNSRQFRKRSPGANYRSCVDSWWADVEMAGDTDHPENLCNLVLAECFPLVNNARTLQAAYLDAHLHKTADRENQRDTGDGQGKRSVHVYSLPQDETQRLYELAERRSAALVRAELERLFLGPLPSEEEMPRFSRAFEIWVVNGIVAFKEGGWDALRRHINTKVAPWLSKYRKRGGDDRTRLFINMFSYQCKVAFYLCYANAWISLIRRLMDHHGLDSLSERFLRLWHYQNQPIEDPSAPGGGHPDVFRGQILALHPLSAIVHSEPYHLRAIAGWIGHPDYEVLDQQGRDADCPAYWKMVATILIAAHEYCHAHHQWDDTRRVATASIEDNGLDPARDDAQASPALFFEEYIQARSIDCPQCHAPLAYRRHKQPDEGSSEVRVIFRCREAGHETPLSIREDDLLRQIEEA
jgi:hypothetical protein